MDVREETLAHIRRVGQLLMEARGDLARRALVHDKSKLESPEAEAFERLTPLLRDTTYGSPEYEKLRADLGEALGDLLSPDRTARLAQAAWAVASLAICSFIGLRSVTRSLRTRQSEASKPGSPLPMKVMLNSVGLEKGVAAWLYSLLSPSIPRLPRESGLW